MSLKTRIKQITPTQVVTASAVIALGVVAGASVYYTKVRTDTYIDGSRQTVAAYLEYLTKIPVEKLNDTIA